MNTTLLTPDVVQHRNRAATLHRRAARWADEANRQLAADTGGRTTPLNTRWTELELTILDTLAEATGTTRRTVLRRALLLAAKHTNTD